MPATTQAVTPRARPHRSVRGPCPTQCKVTDQFPFLAARAAGAMHLNYSESCAGHALILIQWGHSIFGGAYFILLQEIYSSNDSQTTRNRAWLCRNSMLVMRIARALVPKSFSHYLQVNSRIFSDDILLFFSQNRSTILSGALRLCLASIIEMGSSFPFMDANQEYSMQCSCMIL